MNVGSFWHDLQQIVKDPTADPRRTAIAVAIAFFVLLVVAVVVLIALPEEEPEEEDEWLEPAKEKAPRPAWVRWTFGALLAVLALCAIGGLIYGDSWTRGSGACKRCHVLGESVSTWLGGTHAKVRCVACHRSPGAFGPLQTRVRAASDLVANLSHPTGIDSPAVVNQSVCRSCHAKELDRVVVVGAIRVKHSDFSGATNCSQCHGRVGHQPAGATYGALLSGVMTTCADCHDGIIASKACSTCHVGDISAAGTGFGGFAKIDLSPPSNCRGCHTLVRCYACHGIEMPHPANWGDPREHARAGAFDTSVCVRCHDPGCAPCHSGIHDNHGPQWKTEHQTRTPDNCSAVCHNRKAVGDNMCELCHPPGTR